MNALRSTDHALLTESEYHGLFSRIRRYADANRFHAMMKGVADDWSSAMYLFLHPEASFYAEDGKWTGMCDENFCQWHEIMIHDLYIAVYEMSENELQNLFDH